MNILVLVLKFLPELLQLAEGIFSYKEKSGVDKKNFVMNTLQSVITDVAQNSTGGQAKTWEVLAPVMHTLVDSTVAVANEAGAFGSENIENLKAGE